MQCAQCRNVFRVIGEAFNSPSHTTELLQSAAKSLVDEFNLKACHFRLVSRDQKILEDVASYGLSEKFLSKGPVDAERSVTEALQGQVVYVADCSQDSRIQYPMEHAEEGIVSLLTLPLSARGQVLGVMRLSTKEVREFSPDELEFFKVAALFCTSAILHSMFNRIIEHVTQAIRSSLDLSHVLDSIVEVVTEDLRARGCTIQLCAGGERLETRASFGLSPAFLDKINEDPGAAAREALGGTVVAIHEARNDPRFSHFAEVMRENIASMLYVPLLERGTTIGVMCLYTHHPYQFSDDEKYLFTSLGEQCALAIQNAKMYDALKRRYENVVDEFHVWFEHFYSHPHAERGGG